MKTPILLLGILTSSTALAGWHTGKIESIAIGYDGKTIAIGHAGATVDKCTCYPTWPDRYCLNKARDTFKEEYQLLLSAKASGALVSINVHDKTCQIQAMYEK